MKPANRTAGMVLPNSSIAPPNHQNSESRLYHPMQFRSEESHQPRIVL